MPPFTQIVFIQAKVGEVRPLPAAFALLTRKVIVFVNYTCFTSVVNEAKPPPVHVVDLHPPVSHFFACTFSLS